MRLDILTEERQSITALQIGFWDMKRDGIRRIKKQAI